MVEVEFPQNLALLLEVRARSGDIDVAAHTPPVYGRTPKTFKVIAKEAPLELKQFYALWHMLKQEADAAQSEFTKYRTPHVPTAVCTIPLEVRNALSGAVVSRDLAAGMLVMALWHFYPELQGRLTNAVEVHVYFEGWCVGYEKPIATDDTQDAIQRV